MSSAAASGRLRVGPLRRMSRAAERSRGRDEHADQEPAREHAGGGGGEQHGGQLVVRPGAQQAEAEEQQPGATGGTEQRGGSQQVEAGAAGIEALRDATRAGDGHDDHRQPGVGVMQRARRRPRQREQGGRGRRVAERGVGADAAREAAGGHAEARAEDRGGTARVPVQEQLDQVDRHRDECGDRQPPGGALPRAAGQQTECTAGAGEGQPGAGQLHGRVRRQRHRDPDPRQPACQDGQAQGAREPAGEAGGAMKGFGLEHG